MPFTNKMINSKLFYHQILKSGILMKIKNKLKTRRVEYVYKWGLTNSVNVVLIFIERKVDKMSISVCSPTCC